MLNPFKPLPPDLAPQNLNALFLQQQAQVQATHDSASNITFAQAAPVSGAGGDFDEERAHLFGDNERLKRAYNIYHDYSLFMFENPKRTPLDFWKRAAAYFYMKWQIQRTTAATELSGGATARRHTTTASQGGSEGAHDEPAKRRAG